MLPFESTEALRLRSAPRPTARPPLPLYVEPAPDEALLSWLLRLADRLGVSFHALASEAFGIDDRTGPTRWWRRPDPLVLARISERTGVSLARLRRMTLERFAAAYRDDEAPLRFAGRRYDGPVPAQRSAQRIAVCAPCFEKDARPYLRTPWLIGWIAHCPEHDTTLIERCKACGARLRVAPFVRRTPFSPTRCARCSASVLTGGDVLAHPSVMRMQAALWQGKRHGTAELDGLGAMSWKEIVALIDVLIGMVYTGLTVAEQDQIFRSYIAESDHESQDGGGIFDSRHGSLRFLACLIEAWPDSPGATVGRALLTRWLNADRNRLCRHLRPASADPWTTGPNNFDPLIRERLRVLAGVPERRASAEVGHGARVGNHAPEVLIEVVNAGSNTLLAIQRHLEDLCSGAHRMLETDDGEPITSRDAAEGLIEAWDLDLEERLHRLPYTKWARRTPPKLVHKLTFSMPAGTPADKLLLAVRAFAQEQFGFMRRYTLALHTDTPNPHVHVVVKATDEDLQRLNIRKATLRDWREAFASHLRAQGVAAKATHGRNRTGQRSRPRGLYRPTHRRPLPRPSTRNQSHL